MTRTERDLQAVYSDLDGEPISERHLREWLDGVAVPTHHPGSSGHRWAVLAGAAAVAAVAVGIAMVSGSGSGSGSHHGVPAGSGAAVRTSPAGSPAAVRTSANAEVAPTPQVAAQTLLDLLPRRGSVSDLSGVTIDKHPQAGLVYDDGHGAASVTVSLELPPTDSPLTQCPAGQPNCQQLPDGTTVSWQTVREPKEPEIVGQRWTATAWHPDGLAVTVTEYTSALPKIGPVTRAQPPFTVDELKAIVSSSRWRSTVTAEVVQQDARLFTPKPDTTHAPIPVASSTEHPTSGHSAAIPVPSSTDDPTFGQTGQSHTSHSATR